MAAPPMSNSPSNPQQQSTDASNNASVASPKTPQSPGQQSLEQQRIQLLLSINLDLLEEVNRLQAEGQGGVLSETQQNDARAKGLDDKMASQEYVQCLRRIQANLAYMMPKAQPQAAAKMQPGPAHMTPPRHMASMREKYQQLAELFPGWQGLEQRMGGNAGSPSGQPNGAQ
ncbi:uncharacterized protein LTR77_006264 [Saxophila tyrrhenica]|uniref:Uncharacterized protein n=1 Tax=Saxophila tyrrhenica TaxID=1690608 RepID=A0AAV9PBN4_9PEZI|nr:hypothetical protein LTR77_006264 [Saxophila tyrrhenica]